MALKQSDDDSRSIPVTSISSKNAKEIRSDVCYYTNQIVNLVFIGDPKSKWLLVDAGMPNSGEEIVAMAENRFGKDNGPQAILLTHGHFDHVGSIVHLIKHWNVPVYAHPLEFAYLTGKLAYPEADSTVEGGLLARLSRFYPHEPIDITEVLHSLPADGIIPFLTDWKWIHTPGHSPGHVSFFREQDRVLLSGDAFITVRQDSLYKVLIQKEEVHGPPRYFTTNWSAAWNSVRRLQLLDPKIVIAGHGQYMEGEELTTGLKRLVDDFDVLAIPGHGKYVRDAENL